jgi:hypothetical protein
MQNVSGQTDNIASRKKYSPIHETFSESFQAIPSLKVILSFADIRRIARAEHIQKEEVTEEKKDAKPDHNKMIGNKQKDEKVVTK